MNQIVKINSKQSTSNSALDYSFQ